MHFGEGFAHSRIKPPALEGNSRESVDKLGITKACKMGILEYMLQSRDECNDNLVAFASA